MVKEHLAASKRLHKKTMSSKAAATAFLIDVGLLTKAGNLSPRYYSKEAIKAHKKKTRR